MSRPCSIPGCDRPSKGPGGLCNVHYLRRRRHGDPLATTRASPTAIGSPCVVPGCEKPSTGSGLCSTHLGRRRRYGDPLVVPPSKVPMAERTKPETQREWLRRHVDFPGDECLIWPFRKDRGGYGRHREMCILAHGEPPGLDFESAHSCGRGRDGCVNPRHLRWRSTKDNALETSLHRAMGVGPGNGRNKTLTPEAARALYGELHNGTCLALGRKYGVSESYISDLRRGQLPKWFALALQIRDAA